jgi:NAD+ synthase
LPADAPQAALSEAEDDGGFEEVESIARPPEPEPSYDDEIEPSEAEPEAESSGSTEGASEGTATTPAETGGSTPGAAPKKRRHRGGRRHRRRRSGGTGDSATTPAETAAAAPVVREPELARPVASAAHETHTPIAPPPPPVPKFNPPAAVVAQKEIPVAPIKPEAAAYSGLKLPGLDTGRTKKALIAFLQAQRETHGRKRAVMELSGELNSITTSALLVEAFGGEHVELCFFMDGEAGNQNRREQARLVASRLGRTLEIKDLRPMLTAAYAGETQVTEKRRRVRVALEKQVWLSDMAKAQNALVIQSTNKTERLLDADESVADQGRSIWPLGDLYQSQVYELSKVCNIPPQVVESSREFAPAKEMGLKTVEADGLLYQMLDVKVSLAKLVELGVEELKLRAVYQRLKVTAQNRRAPVWEAMTGYYQPRPWNK